MTSEPQPTAKTPSLSGYPFDRLRAPVQRAVVALVMASAQRAWGRDDAVAIRAADLACFRSDAYELGRAIAGQGGPATVCWTANGKSFALLVTYEGGTFHVRDGR